MKTIVFLILIFTIFQSKAIDLGSLDTSFSNDGVSDGWDRSGETGYYRYGSATVVDSQGRIYVAGTYDYDAGGSTAKGARIERYLPSGTLDNTFGTGGIKTFAVPPAPINQFEYSLVLGPSDSIFMGYSRLYCIVGNECHSNIKIYYVNSSGVTVGDITIPFDLGGTWERNDDNISDMVYMPTLNRLAISAEVERGGSQDTDFGVAMVNVDPVTGSLSMDTNFDTDGKNICYFDQGATNDTDSARSIVYNWLQGSVIVGGTSFEGNGVNANGTNLAFCEFNIADGSLLRKWSTQPEPDFLDEREYLHDMVFVTDFVDNGGIILLTSGIVVAATLPGDGNSSFLDFGLTKFSFNSSSWERNISFGENGTGITTTNFQFIFVGDTDDYVAEMLMEPEGVSIVLAGNITWDDGGLSKSVPALAKYTYNGILDTNWGIGKSGKAVTPFDTSVLWDSATSVSIDPNNEELYIAGWSYDGLDFKSLIANFHNDMIFGGNFDF